MSYIDTNLDPSGVGLFAVPAFFVTFRETIEAAIIVSVLLGLLVKINCVEHRRFVWVGVFSALAISVCMAVIALILINFAKDQVFDAKARNIVEGVISIVAAILIAFVAVSIGNVMAKTAKYEKRLAENLNNREDPDELISHHTIFWLAFTAVFREGVETIIFFSAIGASFPPESLPIPAVTGAIAGLVTGWALYKFGGQMTIQWFFRLTMILLIFIGAGVFIVGIRALQEAGAFGVWEPESERPPMNRYIFDISDCCGLDNQFWLLLRVLFGYNPDPTGWEFLMYFLYQLIVWTFVVLRYKSDIRISQGKPGYKEMIKNKLMKKNIPEKQAPVEVAESSSVDSDEQEDSFRITNSTV